VEEWIVGAIDVTELRRRYAQLCGNRLSEKRARRAEPVRHEQTIEVPDDLLSEIKRLIRPLVDQNPFAHSLRPMDMMRQGWLSSFRQASQQ
jgi:hypothetical protein